MSWIKNVQIYMDKRGMDLAFRLYNYKNNKEYYLFEKWTMVRNPDQIDCWTKQLKKGVKLRGYCCPPCPCNLENLQWSGKALQNIVSDALWQLMERQVPEYATGPEVFKMIIMKWKHLSISTICTREQELKTLKIVDIPLN